MKKALVIAGVAACCLSAPVFADSMASLEKAGCLYCHAVDSTAVGVGPTFKQVAAKYKGDKEAEAKLFKKVTEGGSGVWGKMPMAPQKGKMSDAEFKKTIGFILGL